MLNAGWKAGPLFQDLLRQQLKHVNARLLQHQMLMTGGGASFKQLILE